MQTGEGRDEKPEHFCSSVLLYYGLNHEVQQLRRKEANRHESWQELGAHQILSGETTWHWHEGIKSKEKHPSLCRGVTSVAVHVSVRPESGCRVSCVRVIECTHAKGITVGGGGGAGAAVAPSMGVCILHLTASGQSPHLSFADWISGVLECLERQKVSLPYTVDACCLILCINSHGNSIISVFTNQMWDTNCTPCLCIYFMNIMKYSVCCSLTAAHCHRLMWVGIYCLCAAEQVFLKSRGAVVSEVSFSLTWHSNETDCWRWNRGNLGCVRWKGEMRRRGKKGDVHTRNGAGRSSNVVACSLCPLRKKRHCSTVCLPLPSLLTNDVWRSDSPAPLPVSAADTQRVQ